MRDTPSMNLVLLYSSLKCMMEVINDLLVFATGDRDLFCPRRVPAHKYAVD
jgi:hypothetical protein